MLENASVRRKRVKERFLSRILLIGGVTLYGLFILKLINLGVVNPIPLGSNPRWNTLFLALVAASLVAWGLSLGSKVLEEIMDPVGSLFGAAAAFTFSGLFGMGESFSISPEGVCTSTLFFGVFAGIAHATFRWRKTWTPIVIAGSFGIVAQFLGFIASSENFPQLTNLNVGLVFSIFFLIVFLSSAIAFFVEGPLSNIFKIQAVGATLFSSRLIVLLIEERAYPGASPEPIFLLGTLCLGWALALGWLAYRWSSS